MFESGVKVSNLAQLRNDPTVVYQLFVLLQLLRRVIARFQGLKDYFSREHAALNCGVNALQPLWVEKSGAIAREQHAIGVHPRHRKITTGGDCLRTVADHLPAFEKLRDVWMSLVTLKLCVWIDQRIFVIETRDVADVHDIVLHAVNPAAAIRRRVGRKTERVGDAAGRISIVRQLPKLFDADAVNLRLASFIESESLNELFGE